MILSFLFFLFIGYVLYKLVFGFVIPIYKTTRRVKESFRNMQQKMQEQQSGMTGQQPSQHNTAKTTHPPAGDYIDFEEVKE